MRGGKGHFFTNFYYTEKKKKHRVVRLSGLFMPDSIGSALKLQIEHGKSNTFSPVFAASHQDVFGRLRREDIRECFNSLRGGRSAVCDITKGSFPKPSINILTTASSNDVSLNCSRVRTQIKAKRRQRVERYLFVTSQGATIQTLCLCLAHV